MTFDPNIPTHITFPLLQGISTYEPDLSSRWKDMNDTKSMY